MTGGVIVGYEGSDRSRDALAFAEVLAAAQDARLIVACVHPYQPRSSAIGEGGFDREVRAGAQRTAESARELLARAEEAEFCAALGVSPAKGWSPWPGARCRHHRRRVQQPRPLGQVLCGTVATQLVHHAHCAVGVAPAGMRRTPVQRCHRSARLSTDRLQACGLCTWRSASQHAFVDDCTSSPWTSTPAAMTHCRSAERGGDGRSAECSRGGRPAPRRPRDGIGTRERGPRRASCAARTATGGRGRSRSVACRPG